MLFVLQAPEIQTMYRIPFPVSAIRSRMRQEFERNRFINKLPVVDVLLFQSNADYQVSCFIGEKGVRGGGRLWAREEIMPWGGYAARLGEAMSGSDSCG